MSYLMYCSKMITLDKGKDSHFNKSSQHFYFFVLLTVQYIRTTAQGSMRTVLHKSPKNPFISYYILLLVDGDMHTFHTSTQVTPTPKCAKNDLFVQKLAKKHIFVTFSIKNYAKDLFFSLLPSKATNFFLDIVIVGQGLF